METSNYYKPINPTTKYALLFSMYNTENRQEQYMDVLNYYVNTLNFPKENLFVVDSSGNGVPETYAYKTNQLVYDQDKYKDFIDSLPPRGMPSKYEIPALILASKHFDFKDFTYVIKLTCKYKIPEIYTINDTKFDGDMLFQERTSEWKHYQPTEIFGIKGFKFSEIINLIPKIHCDCLEEVIQIISRTFSFNYFPFFYNIANYVRNNNTFVRIINRRSIPKILHEIIYDNYKVNSETWVNLNREYRLKKWDYDNCEKYLTDNFSSDIISCFKNITKYKYKYLFFIYCLVYNEGGWYIGRNNICLVENLLNRLDDNNISSIVCFENINHEASNTINASFFGTYPHNPILKKAINNMVEYFNDEQSDFAFEKHAFFGNLCNQNAIKIQGFYQDNFYHNNIGKIIEHIK